MDAEGGSRGSKGGDEDGGRASSRTRGAEAGGLDTCSKDGLRQPQAEAAAGAVELHLVPVVVVVVVAAVV